MLKWWVVYLCGHIVLHTLVLPEWETEAWCSKTPHSRPNRGHLCQWHVFESFEVQPGLWPSPKSHHRKASYSTAGEVSSLRFLTNCTFHLRRKPSELLAGSVFLARAKRENCSESWSKTLLKAKWHLSHIQQCLCWNTRWSTQSQRQEKGRKFSAYTRGLIW